MSKDIYEKAIKEIDDRVFSHLVEECPNLYVDRHGDYQKTCMVWGFAVEAGWYEIIKDLSFKLEELIIKWRAEHPEEKAWPRAAQVKEKMGVLRFYMEKATDEMREFIGEAYVKTDKTCERCGKPGSLRDLSYVQTLCNSCFEKLKKRIIL